MQITVIDFSINSSAIFDVSLNSHNIQLGYCYYQLGTEGCTQKAEPVQGYKQKRIGAEKDN